MQCTQIRAMLLCILLIFVYSSTFQNTYMLVDKVIAKTNHSRGGSDQSTSRVIVLARQVPFVDGCSFLVGVC